MTRTPVPREAEILRAIRVRLGKRTDVKLWRINSGAFRDANRRLVRTVSVNGMPDLIGVGPRGVFIGIEAKRPGGRQSEDQRRFQRALEAVGGIYILARCADEAEALLDAALRGRP